MVSIVISLPGEVQEKHSLIPFEELVTIMMLFILRDHHSNQRQHVEKPKRS